MWRCLYFWMIVVQSHCNGWTDLDEPWTRIWREPRRKLLFYRRWVCKLQPTTSTRVTSSFQLVWWKGRTQVVLAAVVSSSFFISWWWRRIIPPLQLVLKTASCHSSLLFIVFKITIVPSNKQPHRLSNEVITRKCLTSNFCTLYYNC